ncbi:MAG: hypothetical protein AB7T49_19060 [Oligoflexales bacterium]
MRFRLASSADVFSILKLFHKSNTGASPSSAFLDYKKLSHTIDRKDSRWILTEMDGAPVTAIGLMLEPNQKLCKINKILVDADSAKTQLLIQESLRYCLHFLETETDMDVVYTTTLSLTRQQQDCTAKEGFKVFGVFPNALGEDNTALNGLTAYFLRNSLQEKRYTKIALHPVVAKFFAIAASQCNIPQLPVADYGAILEELRSFEKENEGAPVPQLELIRAPEFVRAKFQDLMAKKSQIANFYPFYRPNCLITDPKQDIEIFIDIYETKRFAAIIGEHVKKSVHPVSLYNEVQKLLRRNNVSYIEVINDAGDSFGNECIIRGGFTPCAYFPAFKSQGNVRRDYVVFGRSFEYLCQPDTNVGKTYMEFFKEYLRVEMHKYFADLTPASDGILQEIFSDSTKK